MQGLKAVAIILPVFFLILVLGKVDGEVVLSLEIPDEYAGIDENLTAYLNITPDRNISAVQCNITFNPSILEAIKIIKGDVFDMLADELIANFTLIDNDTGTINNIVAFSFNSINESGNIVKIIFKTHGEGYANINISDFLISDENSNEVDGISINDSIVVDAIPPSIKINVKPSVQMSGGNVNISALIEDETGIKDVRINISYPDGSIKNYSILENKSGNVFYSNLSYSTLGKYEFYVYAMDFAGNTNRSEMSSFNIYEENIPPVMPHNPSPSNGSIDIPPDTTLSWQCTDPDGDSITYDIYFGASPNPPLVINNQSSSSYTPPSLSYSTTYYWRVVAWDEHQAKNTSPVWHFTTKANSEPGKPTLTGAISGYTGLSIIFYAVATDPDGDRIRYGLDWNNDGIVDEWTLFYNSGTTASVTHVWNSEGTYYVKAVAEDEYGLQGEWSEARAIIITQYSPPNQPPTVEITSPSNGSTVSGIVEIQGISNDPDGIVERVEVKIDNGGWNEAEGTTSWQYEWNTSSALNGEHVIYARSYDGSDYSNIVSIRVIVNNAPLPSNNPPNVEITSPENGKKFKDDFTVQGIAWDRDGNESIVKVEIRIDDGEWKEANGKTVWSYSVSISSMTSGEHVIYARSYDGKDYSNMDMITFYVQMEGGGGGYLIYIIAVIIAASLFAILGLIYSRKKGKKKVVEAREEKKCFVCLGKFKPNSKIIKCECGALFHKSCAERVKTCPNCGRKLV